MVCNQFELVSWIYFVDQQKSTWFESVFCVSYASFITTLLTIDYGPFVACEILLMRSHLKDNVGWALSGWCQRQCFWAINLSGKIFFKKVSDFVTRLLAISRHDFLRSVVPSGHCPKETESVKYRGVCWCLESFCHVSLRSATPTGLLVTSLTTAVLAQLF